MNPLLDQFEQTTVDTEAMRLYLLGVPRYYECGLATGVSPQARLLLRRTDFVEFELRQFVAGQCPTMYHLNRAIRQFLAVDERAARALTAFTLWAVQKTLLEKEWYEVVPRFQTACQRIQHRFQIQPAAAPDEPFAR